MFATNRVGKMSGNILQAGQNWLHRMWCKGGRELMDAVSQIYAEIGGTEQPFLRLVEEFYSRVEGDAVLRPLYPDDLSQSKRHLALFLIQRCGGKATYSQERGHPRMRARHLPFPIGVRERDAWLRNMSEALNAVPEFAAQRETLSAYFEEFATFLMNKL